MDKERLIEELHDLVAGIEYQISTIREMLNDEDDGKSQRVMRAMLQMGKLDIKALKQAYEQQ